MSVVAENLAKIRFWCDQHQFRSQLNPSNLRDATLASVLAASAITPIYSCVAVASGIIAKNPELISNIFSGCSVVGYSLLAAQTAMKVLASCNTDVEFFAKIADGMAETHRTVIDKQNLILRDLYSEHASRAYTINTFDDDGAQTGTKNVQLTKPQIEGIVGTAAKFVASNRDDDAYPELVDALVESNALDQAPKSSLSMSN